jgi:4-amino-4-deoxy-L-arabinose transferase-like glycosyltransferase
VPPRAVLLLIAVALAAVLAGLGNDFTQDDLRLIYENGRVHGLGRWREILGSPYWPPPWNQELYRPVVSLLHAIQYALGGGEPLLFRLVSYLLYVLTAVAVLRLAGRLAPAPIALLAALLFAAHPVHVEAVALAVGQSELLVALLALVMTILYLDRRRDGGLRPVDWLVLGALYVVASMTKEQGLLIPALLLAAELTLIDGTIRQRIKSVAGGFGSLAVLAVAVVLVRRVVLQGQFTGVFVSEALQGQDLTHRALTLLQIIPHWARLLVWPAALQADYAPGELWTSSRLGAAEALGLAILLLALIAAWLLRRRAPAVTFGILWMGITLFPVSNLIVPTGFLLAERTLFLPSVGLAIALAGAMALVPAPGSGLSRELAIAGGVLVLLGIGRSAERQRVWRNEAFLTVRTVQDAPRSYRAQRAYGDVLFNLGHDSLALAAYGEALRLAPAGHAWRVRNDLARRYRVRGETAREVEQLRRSLEELPSQGDVRGYLISGYLLLGRYADAAREVDSAVAHGGRPDLFRRLREIADSAARVGAPPGSIRIRMVTEPSR